VLSKHILDIRFVQVLNSLMDYMAVLATKKLFQTALQ